MATIQIGATVRVKWGDAARRATIACILEESDEVEVIFQDDNTEAVVATQKVSDLQPFESQPCATVSYASVEASEEAAAKHREEGNILFKLGDAVAAAERYSLAIDALAMLPDSWKTSVLPVLVASNRLLWLAHVAAGAGASGSLLQLEFCKAVSGTLQDEGTARPKPMKVAKDRLLLAHDGSTSDLQAALYLNRARCWLSLNAPARAVQDAALVVALRHACLHGLSAPPPAQTAAKPSAMSAGAIYALGCALALMAAVLAYDDRSLYYSFKAGGIAIILLGVAISQREPSTSKSSGASEAVANTQPDTRLCQAFFLRGKARVRQGRLAAAQADLESALAVASAPAQKSDLDRLKREILEAKRDNKRLAKEVSKWCETAMAKAKPDAFAAVAEG